MHTHKHIQHILIQIIADIHHVFYTDCRRRFYIVEFSLMTYATQSLRARQGVCYRQHEGAVAAAVFCIRIIDERSVTSLRLRALQHLQDIAGIHRAEGNTNAPDLNRLAAETLRLYII